MTRAKEISGVVPRVYTPRMRQAANFMNPGRASACLAEHLATPELLCGQREAQPGFPPPHQKFSNSPMTRILSAMSSATEAWPGNPCLSPTAAGDLQTKSRCDGMPSPWEQEAQPEGGRHPARRKTRRNTPLTPAHHFDKVIQTRTASRALACNLGRGYIPCRFDQQHSC